MLYAKEVIDLMGAFPGREFRMHEIVQHVARGRPANRQERNRYREGSRLVLHALVKSGHVRMKPARRGAPALYIWKVPNDVLA